MGWLKKITGIAQQERANAANAKAITEAARQSSQAAQNSAIDQARTTSEAQAADAARQAAISKAKEVAETPMDVADVQLEAASEESAAATSRRKRGQFGRDYLSGVGI